MPIPFYLHHNLVVNRTLFIVIFTDQINKLNQNVSIKTCSKIYPKHTIDIIQIIRNQFFFKDNFFAYASLALHRGYNISTDLFADIVAKYKPLNGFHLMNVMNS